VVAVNNWIITLTDRKMMQVIDIVLIAVTIVLAVAAIVLNGLVSSVIVAAEKVNLCVTL